MYPPDHLEALAAVLRQHPHVLIVSDEIYEKITCAKPAATLVTLAPADLTPWLGPRHTRGWLRRYDVPHVAFGALDGMFDRCGQAPSPVLACSTSAHTDQPCHLCCCYADCAQNGDDQWLLEGICDDWISNRLYGRAGTNSESLHEDSSKTTRLPKLLIYISPGWCSNQTNGARPILLCVQCADAHCRGVASGVTRASSRRVRLVWVSTLRTWLCVVSRCASKAEAASLHIAVIQAESRSQSFT